MKQISNNYCQNRKINRKQIRAKNSKISIRSYSQKQLVDNGQWHSTNSVVYLYFVHIEIKKLICICFDQPIFKLEKKKEEENKSFYKKADIFVGRFISCLLFSEGLRAM